jgi:acyl dehydratase
MGLFDFQVTAEDVRRYAEATGEVDVRYFRESRDAVAPPLFAVVPATKLFERFLIDPQLSMPLDRTLHGEHSIVFSTPIVPGDWLVSTGAVIGVARRSTGQTVSVRIETSSREGELRNVQVATAFIRDARPGPRERRMPSQTRTGEPCVESCVVVSREQPIAYAAATDTAHVLPHTDEDFARSIGYETIFLQGQCALALAAKVIVENVAGGRPEDLRMLSTRFAHVAYPGDTLKTRVWRSGDGGRYDFEMANDSGALVLADGVAEVGRTPPL